MDPTSTTIRTEVRGLDLSLDRGFLTLTQAGDDLIAPVLLAEGDAERLRLEMAKAQLWEWNQFEETRSRATLRYRRYLASWLTMCLAAFSAYLSYPSFYLPAFLSLFSIFLWWRAAYVERKAADEAQAERNRFRPDWDYLRERLEESETADTREPKS